MDRYLETRIEHEASTISYGGDLTQVEPYPISIAWPEERRVVNLGRILVTGEVPNSAEAEKPIGFLPGKELPGLARGDDPFFAARDAVYAVAFARRNP